MERWKRWKRYEMNEHLENKNGMNTSSNEMRISPQQINEMEHQTQRQNNEDWRLDVP